MVQNFIARHRIGVSRVFFLVLISIALFSDSVADFDSGVRLCTLIVASGLVVVAVLGRLWSSLYLCGYKNSSLVDVGPFSMVRNPLYIFSLLGATGIGIATTSITITLLIIAFFIVVYPSVISKEEERLESALGSGYREYMECTPRLVPNYKLYKGVTQYTVNMKQVHSAFLDVVWFFIVLGLARMIPTLHDAEILPISF